MLDLYDVIKSKVVEHKNWEAQNLHTLQKEGHRAHPSTFKGCITCHLENMYIYRKRVIVTVRFINSTPMGFNIF